jgi:hypothetical protein
MDIGEERPDRSGDPSERNLDLASRCPTALVFDDPTAGAAFWPSTPPNCIRLSGRNVVEFAVDTTDSVGLTGRSIGEETPALLKGGRLVAAIGDSALRGSRGGV